MLAALAGAMPAFAEPPAFEQALSSVGMVYRGSSAYRVERAYRHAEVPDRGRAVYETWLGSSDLFRLRLRTVSPIAPENVRLRIAVRLKHKGIDAGGKGEGSWLISGGSRTAAGVFRYCPAGRSLAEIELTAAGSAFEPTRLMEEADAFRCGQAHGLPEPPSADDPPSDILRGLREMGYVY